MDGLAFHPYADTSGQSPDTPHPKSTTIGLADYDRLIQTLGAAFDGTAQAGYDAADPLRRVRRRVDDPGRQGEGVHRRGADDDASPSTRSPRASTTGGAAARVLPAERRSASSSSTRRTSRRSRAGSRASTTPTGRRSRASTPSAMRSPAPAAARSPAATGSGSTSRRRRCASRRRPSSGAARAAMQFTCSLDCAWELRASSARDGEHAARRLTGYGRAGAPLVASLKGRKLGAGPIRFSLTLTHPVNPGEPADARERARSASAEYALRTHEREQDRRTSASRASRSGSTSRTASSRSTPPGGASRSRSARPARTRSRRSSRTGPAGWKGLRAYNVSGIRPGGRLLPLADHRALRRPARARRRAQRHAARRLADDAVLVPRNDEAVGLHRQEARPPGQGDPARGAVPRRLPVREEAAVVLPHLRGAGRRDAASTRRSAASSSPSRTTRPTRSGSTTRSSCRRSSARSRPTSCT